VTKLDNRDSIPGRGWDISPHHRFQNGSQLPIQWVTGALFLGVKRKGREADHSPPSSAEVNNAWICTFSTPIRLYSVVLN